MIDTDFNVTKFKADTQFNDQHCMKKKKELGFVKEKTQNNALCYEEEQRFPPTVV